MGRKKGASYVPNYPDDGPPPPRPTNRQPANRPWRNNQQQPSVSQPSVQSLVDAWRSYRSDNAMKEAIANAAAQANFAAPYMNPYGYPPQQSQYQPWQQQSWRPQQYTQPHQLHPQAPAFQPGQRLVNGYSRHSNYRVDKSSRYNLRSSQARPFSMAAADQVLQSIESNGLAPVRQVSSRSPRTTRRGTTPINTEITPVPEPRPTQEYLETAKAGPVKLLQSQKLLVLLDLNGTLVYRSGSHRQYTHKRPGVDRLLTYLFANHNVMLFTSATRKSADRMALELLTQGQRKQLITTRTREDLGLSPSQFRNKVQVYKDLTKVWADSAVLKSGAKRGVKWDMTNTVLIDDSTIKATSHPHNLLLVDEFIQPETIPVVDSPEHTAWEEVEKTVMLSVEAKLEQLRWHASVACLIRQWQEGVFGEPKVEAATVKNDKKTLKPIKEEINAARKYPTPISIDSSDETEGEAEGYSSEDAQGVKLPATEADSKVLGAGRGVRSVSPVTEKAFRFMSLGEKRGQDKGKGRED